MYGVPRLRHAGVARRSRDGGATERRRVSGRAAEYLNGHLELLRCSYNYVRPHSALRYGTDVWTPAMQAGLASKRLSFRDIFMSLPEAPLFVAVVLWAMGRPRRSR